MQFGLMQVYQFWFFAVAGWVNQRQNYALDYLKEENQILKSKIKTKRIRFTYSERKRLAVRAKRVGRKRLEQIANIASPDTLLGWYRKLIAWKWTFSRKGPDRHRTKKDIVELILRMARENAGWGYTRILGALKNFKCKISRTAIANTLKEN